MLIQKTTIAALALLLTLGLFAPMTVQAEAAPPTPAAQFVQKMGDKALSSLTGKDLTRSAREARVRDLLRTNFDVPTIGRFALGTYWRTATEKQKQEYNRLFEEMIVTTYAARFEEYSGQAFKVVKSVEAGATDSIVSSQIMRQDGPPVDVQWRVRSKNGGFKIVDVIVEDISMSVTQRSDFASVIQSKGGEIDGLLETLRAKKKSTMAQK